jgi:predicted amidohydrolase YtcJ
MHIQNNLFMEKLIIIATIMTTLLSCSSQKKQADLIITNAKIYTVNNTFEVKESFAVKNGKFIAVGPTEEILETYVSDSLIDLKGKPVYPGFYDAHCHFHGYGMNLQKADLVGTKSFDEVVERVRQHAKSHPSEWVLGRGWDQNDWPVKEFPTKEKLDAAFPDKPVVLTRIDGHALIVNSEALERAGITTDSKVEGGKFIKKNDQLTGVLRLIWLKKW